MEEGSRSVKYTLQAILSFDAELANGSIFKTSTSSTPVKILYVPHVSYASATVGMVGGAQQSRTAVTNAAAIATASCRPSPSGAPPHETSGQLMIDSQLGGRVKAINASVRSKSSVCIGDHASMVLKVDNDSDITLQSIRLSLVRQISFLKALAGSCKTPTVLQLAPIPITLTSVPSYSDGRKARPIPHHMEVEDRPTFIRDRFEEEMIQQLSSLESLVMDGDDDDLDIDLLVEEARRRRHRHRDTGSSEDSDDADEDDYEGERDQEDEEQDDPRFMSRVPARFRHPYRNSSLPMPAAGNSGLSTPPPSPPYLSKALSDDSLMVQTMRERPSMARNMAIANANVTASSSIAIAAGALDARSTPGSKTCSGLSKALLMDLHQIKGQLPRSSI
ncbi:hypothetical protein EC991_002504 [Linnemannia zychae]|nr:hypothetical protein EC991_002504 [Linnemannia zychae]